MLQKFIIFVVLFGLLNIKNYPQLDSWETIYTAVGNDFELNMTINKNVIYICGALGVKKSVDANSVWISLPNLSKNEIFKNICVTYDNVIFVNHAYNKSILRTTDDGESWDTLFTDFSFTTMTKDNAGGIWLARSDGVLLNSTDNGKNWLSIERFLGNSISWINFNKNDDIFICCYQGVFYKNKNDTTWVKISDKNATSFAAKGNDTLIISNYYDGTYLTTNKGITWKNLPNAQVFNSIIFDSAGNIWGGINSSSIFYYTGVLRSTDMGETWKYMGGSRGANKMICSGNILCIADKNGVCRYNKNITPYLGNDFFPLRKNNKWMSYKYPRYNSKYGEAKIDTLLITKDTIINELKYYFVSGVCGFTKQSYWYRFDNQSRILYVRYNDTDRVMLNYNLLHNERFARFDLATGKYYISKCIRGVKNIFDSTRNYIGFYDFNTNGFSGWDYLELYYERIGYGYLDYWVNPHGAPESTTAIRIICALINDGDSIKIYRKTYAPEVSYTQAVVKRPYILTLNVKADHYYSFYNPNNLPGCLNFVDSVFLTGYYKKNDSITFTQRYELSYKDSAVNYTLSQKLDSSLITRGFDFYYRVTAKDKCFIPYYTSLPDTGYFKLIIDTLTSVIHRDDIIKPVKFYLSQNFPNPFNPSTTIKYSLPEESRVQLLVFNSLGQKIKELVNARQATGNYEISFVADELSSGVYFYQLKANGFMQTRKLIIQK